MEPLLTPEQVSHYLGVPLKTLYVWRTRGGGPPAIRIGKHLRYRPDDFDIWVNEQAHKTAKRER